MLSVFELRRRFSKDFLQGRSPKDQWTNLGPSKKQLYIEWSLKVPSWDSSDWYVPASELRPGPTLGHDGRQLTSSPAGSRRESPNLS